MLPEWLRGVSLARLIRIALVLSIATQALFAQRVEVGKPAPALAIAEWIRGEPLLAFERGKPYVIALWSSACESCKWNVETFSRLQTRFERSGLRVIVVANRQDDPRASLVSTKEFVKTQGDALRFTVAWDIDTRTNCAYLPAKAVNAHPATIVDPQGNVAYIGLPPKCEALLVALEYVAWDRAKAERLFEEFQRLDTLRNGAMPHGEALTKALTDVEDLLKTCPPLASVSTLADFHFELLLRAGKLDAAYALGNRLVDEAIAARDALRLHLLAWKIVDPATRIERRDLALALRAASKSVELGETNAYFLSVLARVHFWRNDLDQTLEVQRRAVSLDKDPDLRKELEEYEAAAKAAGAPAKKGG